MFKNQKNSHFLEKLRIKEAPGYSFFKNFKEPQVLLKESAVFMRKTSGSVNGYFILSILRIMVIYQPGYFILENHGYEP
jgi:hypothetical protein